MRQYVLLILLFATLSTAGQTQKDSVSYIVKKINQIYPGIRPYSIQFESPSRKDYSTQLFNEDFEKGKIAQNYRIRSFGAFPIVSNRQINVSGSISHLYQHIETTDVYRLSSSTPPIMQSSQFDFHDVTLSVTAIHKDSIANKSVIFSSSAMLNSRNIKSVEKFKALFSASVILKATKNTVLTAGMVGIIDPSSLLPFFPTFTYWHRFPASQWQLDFILPSRLSVRRPAFGMGWFTMGAELSGTHAFSTPGSALFSGDYEHSTLMIQSGATFEFPVASNLLLGLKTGVENTVTSRMVKVNEKSTNYVGDHRVDPSLFLNVSLSFVPGLKGKQ